MWSPCAILPERSRVVQLVYATWPDHGAPASARQMLNFRAAVGEMANQVKAPGPVVVHCSAGVGRTETAFDEFPNQSGTFRSPSGPDQG